MGEFLLGDKRLPAGITEPLGLSVNARNIARADNEFQDSRVLQCSLVDMVGDPAQSLKCDVKPRCVICAGDHVEVRSSSIVRIFFSVASFTWPNVFTISELDRV